MLLLNYEPVISLIRKYKSNDSTLKTKLQEFAPDATSTLVEMIKEERKHKEVVDANVFRPGVDSPPDSNFKIGVMRTTDTKAHTEREAITADNSPSLVSEQISQQMSPQGTMLMKRKAKMEREGA